MIEIVKTHKLVFFISMLALMGATLFFVFGPEIIYFSEFTFSIAPVKRKPAPNPKDLANLASHINLSNVSNIRIKSISKDEINYYVSFSYTTSTQNEDGSSNEQNHDDVVTASTDVVDEHSLGEYVANEIDNRFDGVDTSNIEQQVDSVLGTSNWEAPASSGGTPANLGPTGSNPNTTDPNTQNNNNNDNTGDNTEDTSSTDSTVPPSPTVYYPPYDGPPIPDVDNSTSSVPIPN